VAHAVKDSGSRNFSEHTQIQVAKDQVSTDLGGEAAILNLANGVYYGLDSVAARVWSLIQQPMTFGEVRDALMKEYEVDAPRLDSDLRTLLTQLAHERLVQVSE
jgi:hypothetical protein